jgi:hypothetical protein
MDSEDRRMDSIAIKLMFKLHKATLITYPDAITESQRPSAETRALESSLEIRRVSFLLLRFSAPTIAV